MTTIEQELFENALKENLFLRKTLKEIKFRLDKASSTSEECRKIAEDISTLSLLEDGEGPVGITDTLNKGNVTGQSISTSLLCRPHLDAEASDASIESDILWMFSCKENDQKKLLDALFTPGTSSERRVETLGLRGYILFMCMSYYDFENKAYEMQCLLARAFKILQKRCIEAHSNLELLCFWLCNLENLLSSMADIDDEDVPGYALQNFDISEHRIMFFELAVHIFENIQELMATAMANVLRAQFPTKASWFNFENVFDFFKFGYGKAVIELMEELLTNCTLSKLPRETIHLLYRSLMSYYCLIAFSILKSVTVVTESTKRLRLKVLSSELYDWLYFNDLSECLFNDDNEDENRKDEESSSSLFLAFYILVNLNEKDCHGGTAQIQSYQNLSAIDHSLGNQKPRRSIRRDSLSLDHRSSVHSHDDKLNPVSGSIPPSTVQFSTEEICGIEADMNNWRIPLEVKELPRAGLQSITLPVHLPLSWLKSVAKKLKNKVVDSGKPLTFH